MFSSKSVLTERDMAVIFLNAYAQSRSDIFNDFFDIIQEYTDDGQQLVRDVMNDAESVNIIKVWFIACMMRPIYNIPVLKSTQLDDHINALAAALIGVDREWYIDTVSDFYNSVESHVGLDGMFSDWILSQLFDNPPNDVILHAHLTHFVINNLSFDWQLAARKYKFVPDNVRGWDREDQK